MEHRLDFTRVIKQSIHILTILILLGLSWSAAAAGQPTLLAETVVDPALSPGFGATCTTNWMKITDSATGTAGYYTLNTNQAVSSTNSATWRPSLAVSGTYKVEAFIPNHSPLNWPCPVKLINWDTSDAHYVIYDSTGTGKAFSGNQAPLASQWLSLGNYHFNQGTGGYVKLTDLNDETNISYSIGFSAMRFTLVSADAGTVSGQVLLNGSTALSSVNINVSSGASTTTNASGSYSLAGVPTGTYTVTPQKDGYTFSPASRSVTVPPDASGINFSASPAGRYISGKVTDAQGAPIANVPLLIKGLTWSKTTSTDSLGRYVFGNLVMGYYQVTSPAGSPYTLSPKVRTYVALLASQENQNFSTARLYGSLTGKITDNLTGQVVAGASINAGGKTGTSGVDGRYTIVNILSGNHTIYIQADGYQDFKSDVTIVEGQAQTLAVVLQTLHVDGYRLPYRAGTAEVLTQGNHNEYSHIESNYKNEYAFDFGMHLEPVVAARAGKVMRIAVDINGSKYIDIQHAPDAPGQPATFTRYLHLNDNNMVKVGQCVNAGQVIATSGNTGGFGYHLHFVRYPIPATKSIPTTFIDPDVQREPGGQPVEWKPYISDNVQVNTCGTAAALVADNTPPAGDVAMQVTGTDGQYRLHLWGVDETLEDVTMRVAATEADLASAAWQPVSETLEWTSPQAAVQFADPLGNVSPVYGESIEAVSYEDIQPAFSVEGPVCTNNTVSIINQSDPYCMQCSWRWDFGNGTFSKTAEPFSDISVEASNFTGYSQTGEYTITLQALNANKTSQHSQTVQVLPSPSGQFTVSWDGLTAALHALDEGAAQYLWDFGDGATGSGQSVTHTFAELGTYQIQLNVIGTNGCERNGYQVMEKSSVFLPLVTR